MSYLGILNPEVFVISQIALYVPTSAEFIEGFSISIAPLGVIVGAVQHIRAKFIAPSPRKTG